MTYKHKSKLLEYQRNYQRQYRKQKHQKVLEYEKRSREKHHEKVNERSRLRMKKRYWENPVLKRSAAQVWRIKIRKEGIEKYGGKCACCGEVRYEFLTFDHIVPCGKRGREQQGGKYLPAWLKAGGYPTGFQILCWNCNTAKQFHGLCPHNSKDKVINEMQKRFRKL